jgi:hypothetical protein
VYMDPLSIKIYTSDNVPRLRYIAGIILGDILGLSWEVITDRRKLGKHPVINYSTITIKDSFKINPVSLLFEAGTSKQNIIMGEWKNLPVFFQTPPDSDIPFDIFAASFFLVTRYEEYLEFQPDEYGRFMSSSSLACKHGFVGKPVVDLWTKEFSRVLLKKYPTLAFRRNEYNALLTIDTDQPFAYLGKNIITSVGGLLRDFTLKTGNAANRYGVVARGKKDPYEVYDYITEHIEKHKTDTRFFFSVGDHSKYDKNPSWKNEEYRKLINRIADKYLTGLHPSFYASESSPIIGTELNRLKSIVAKEIIISRFHYIRISFPSSYRHLLKEGITEDYSMGYPDEPGFRAGIARPFYFYDVSEDQQTNLRIVPFQVMDATLFQYKNLDPPAAQDIVIKLIDETRKAGGLFVSIWHNTSLLDDQEWSGWREVFESMLQYQKS